MDSKIGLKKEEQRKGRKIQTRVRICIECGSTNTSIDNTGIFCNDCKLKRLFIDSHSKSAFKKGEIVRIVENDKDSEFIYKILKVKKSADGRTVYLLKTDANPITLLYHQSEESYLEKVE